MVYVISQQTGEPVKEGFIVFTVFYLSQNIICQVKYKAEEK